LSYSLTCSEYIVHVFFSSMNHFSFFYLFIFFVMKTKDQKKKKQSFRSI